ncbi:MAG: DHH family phosphoesterase [Haloarculaceae archaeon]
MVVRLVLGSGSLASRIAEALSDRPGEVRVVTDIESRATALRDAGISVEQADPTDPGALAGISVEPDLVAAFDADGDRNLAAAEAAETSYAGAYLVAYTGENENPVAAADFEPFADRVVDPRELVSGLVLGRVGLEGLRQRRLLDTLRSVSELAIVTHENPDPDAIASAAALSRLAERAECTATICYYGEISHQENRAFVNLLEFELRHLESEDDLEEFDGFALVDHSRPGVNDGLPPDLEVDVVIDHHPPRAPVEARFVDLRSDVGATSTLLVEYLEHFGMEMETAVATGLLFGIRVDTHEFNREVSPVDFEAAATLLPHADLGTLERIESPSMSAETIETIASAITNRRREGEILLSCVGRLADRDALAQAAERLLELDDVTTTVVYGVRDGTIYVSARTRGTDIDIGETLRDAFGQIGSAGAQIDLGLLEAVEDHEDSLIEMVESIVSDRLLETLETRADRSIVQVPSTLTGSPEASLVPEADSPPDLDDGEATESDGESHEGGSVGGE